MAEQEPGACVAPGCESRTPSKYHDLCDACEKRVKEAMIRARPSLLELMHKERDEAEAWLMSPWLPPSRRWAILDNDYHEVPLDDIVRGMVDRASGEWDDTTLGFVDDDAYARKRARREKYAPESEPAVQTGWRIGEDSPATRAWREHLAGLLRPALEQALATFPLRWAGYEIKTALVQQDGYGADGYSMALDEIDEGTGGCPISPLARDYVDLRFDPKVDEHADPTFADECWWRYVALAPEIMAILDAVKAADA